MAAQPVFVGSGSLNDARYGHAAVLLQDGRVLVVGGWGLTQGWYSTALTSSELYDPAVITTFFAGAVACSGGGPSHWSATTGATPSRFKPGKAAINAYMSVCDSDTCDAEVSNVTINLTAKR